MINSIQYFQEKGVKRLTEIFSKYTDDLTKFAEMVQGVTKEVLRCMQRRILSLTVFICINISYQQPVI
jgi:hypothetical protein